MPRNKFVIAAIAAALVKLCCASQAAHASGFGIFTHGASALGQADAVVAHPDGPSAIFFNPALMNSLEGTQIEVGTTAIFPLREFKSSTTGDTTEAKNQVFFPSTFYAVHKINDRISAGLGVFNPFGLGTNWGDTWEGRYLAGKSELQTFNINPAVSYQIFKGLSVAAGIDIVLLDVTLENKVPSATLGIPGLPFDVKQKFSGSGTGIGFNTGIYYALNNYVSIGASYRSQVKVDIDGDLTLDISPTPVNAKTSLTLPQQVYAGIACNPSDRFTIETGMRWEDWASFKELRLDLAGGTSTAVPRSWHSTYSVNAGGKYKLNDWISILGGYFYGWNSVPDSTFEPAIPDSDIHSFSLGTHLRFDSMSIALSYAYQLQDERIKEQNLYPGANGSYNSQIHLVGLSLGYNF